MRKINKNLAFYLAASLLLSIAFFFFYSAYRQLSFYATSGDRINSSISHFKNLSLEINNAAVSNADLIKQSGILTPEKIFFADSQQVIQELNILKAGVDDSINIQIVKKLDQFVKSELAWLINSNVPDSIVNNKASAHIEVLQAINSLIVKGINRANFLNGDNTIKIHHVFSEVRRWIIVFIVLLSALLLYTVINLFIQKSKRIRREKEVEHANRLLLNAQRIGRIGNWTLKTGTGELYWSDEVYNIFNLPLHSQVSYAGLLKSIHADDKELFTNENMAFLKGEKDFDIEHRIILADGSIKWLHAKAIIAGKTGNNNVVIEGTVLDITQRKQQEEAAHKRELHFQSTLDNLLEGIQIIGFDWKYIYVNEALGAYSKYTKKELIGNTIMKMYPGVENSLLYKELHECMSSRVSKQLETDFDFPDGSKKYFQLSIEPVPEGILILSVDRTDKQNAEQKLHKVNRLYAFISSINQSIVYITDQQEILDKACKVAVETGNFKMALVELIDTETGKMNMVSIVGEEAILAATTPFLGLDYDSPALSATPTGKAIKFGKPSISNHVQDDPGMIAYKSELVRNGIKASSSFPLKKFGSIIGTIGFHSGTEDFFDEEEIALLTEAVGDISFCLENIERAAQHKLTEELVAKNEKRFRALIERSTDMKTLSNPEGLLTYCSPAVIKVLGYSSDELLFKPASNFFHPLDIPHLVKNREMLLQTPGSSYNFQYRFRHKNGSWKWCEGTFTNLLNEPGIHAMVANFRDISERKLAEAQREFDRQNLEALINNTKDLMWSIDRNFNLITSNKPFDENIKQQFDLEKIEGNILKYARSTELAEHFKNFYERAFKGEIFTETEYTPLPEENWLEISYYPMRQGEEVIGTACHSRDITRIKQTEANLLRSKERLNKSQERAHLGHWQFDVATSITSWSDETCRIYGLLPSDNRHPLNTFDSFIHPADVEYVLQANLQAAKSFGTNILTYRIILQDGTIKWIYVESKAEFDAEGKQTGIFGIVHDISERKKIEEEKEMVIKELVKSNADLKQFTFITSHNLRAPLSNIQSICQLIDYSDINESNTKLLEMLNSSGQQLTKTIDDLTNILVIKNNENAEIQSISLPAIFKKNYETFGLVLQEINADVTTDFQVSTIKFNQTYLESILINLFSNAIKYRSPNRNLIISITSKSDHNGDLVLSFSDNGSGLDLKRYKDRIFGLYQRFHSDVEGSGLGLYIVKSQIESMKGQIEIDSELEKGTTFLMKFPGSLSS